MRRPPAFADARRAPSLHAVQTEGCAPLDRAWQRRDRVGAGGRRARRGASCMWPWEAEPRSAADGILDDETYDWLGVVQALRDSGGRRSWRRRLS